MTRVRGLHLCSTATLFPQERKQLWLHSTTHQGVLTRHLPRSTEDTPMVGDTPPSMWRWTTCEPGTLWSTGNVLPRHGVLAGNPTVSLERCDGSLTVFLPRRRVPSLRRTIVLYGGANVKCFGLRSGCTPPPHAPKRNAVEKLAPTGGLCGMMSTTLL